MKNRIEKIIFLINGEPLDIYDKSARKHRIGNLISICENRQIDFEVWTSNFYHQEKIKVNANKYLNNFNYKVINTIGYNKNISLLRLIDHIYYSLIFFIKFNKYNLKNSIVISAFPIPEVCFFATLICKKKNIPIIIDIRDQWPDIFFDKKNIISKTLLKIIFYYQTLINKYTFKNCSGIYSITKNFLTFGSKHREQINNKNNRVFPLAYKKKKYDFDKDLTLRFRDKLSQINFNKTNICFFGVINFKKFDFLTLFDFIEHKSSDIENFNFIICGSGDDENLIHNFKHPSLQYLGWLNEAEISFIASKSHWGLANYKPTNDFNMSIPNKIIEYLSYGLPIIHSLKGDTYNFLNQNNINYFYEYKNLESLSNLFKKIDKDTKNEMHAHNLNIFNKNFNSDIIYNDMIETLLNFNEN